MLWCRKKWVKCVCGGLCCALLLVFGYGAGLAMTGNVHQLPDGLIYRSGVLGRAGIEHLVREHGVRSVLNLCGPNPQEPWYASETNTCAALGVKHADLALSARRQLDEPHIREVLQVLRELPRPTLVHCRGGADRTGLVCALYRYDIVGDSPAVAAEELSLLYGHIPYFHWRDSIAMDHSFWSHVTNSINPSR